MIVDGAKLVRGWWLPETEHHFEDMIRNRSKVGDIDGRGTYQYHKLRRAMATVPDSRRRVAIDVGAQVGLWSWHLAKMFERVECFEPLPIHIRCFEANMQGRDNATMHQVALSDAPGRLTITMPAHVTGNAHVVRSDTPAVGEKRGEMFDVEAKTLDCFELERVDLIKIDVEGTELDVLRGAKLTLLRCRPYMIVEQKGNDATIYGHPRNEAITWLRTLGCVTLWDHGGDHLMHWPT